MSNGWIEGEGEGVGGMDEEAQEPTVKPGPAPARKGRKKAAKKKAAKKSQAKKSKAKKSTARKKGKQQRKKK